MRNAIVAPSGTVGLRTFRNPPQGARGFMVGALPHRGLGTAVNRWRLRNLPRLTVQFLKVQAAVTVGRMFGVATMHGRLTLRAVQSGYVVDYGIASYRVVTTAGATKIVDFLRANDTTTGAAFKFHGFGTGTTAENVTDTALVTELTTQYATDSTRPTGTQTNNGATVYQTVATVTPDSGGTIAVTEHGIFSASSGGSLLDRSKFSAVNLDSTQGDSLQSTYSFTVTAGS